MRNTILQGDALEVLRTLPAGIAQCCVTSPPYYGLRDYGHEGQIGLEPEPGEYLTRLVDVFAEVHRVLRPDGVLWLNMGDSYAEKTRAKTMHSQGNPAFNKGRACREAKMPARSIPEGWKPKDLMGMPWRLALALQADGWYLRADCVWSKTNAMPESVRDRPAKAHEYMFLLAKSERYYYDIEATRQPLKEKTRSTWGCKVSTRGGDALGKVKSDNWAKTTYKRKPRLNADGSIAGAHLRSVWSIASQPYRRVRENQRRGNRRATSGAHVLPAARVLDGGGQARVYRWL